MPSITSHFSVFIAPTIVLVRAFSDNAIEKLKLYYKSKCSDRKSIISPPINGIYSFSLTHLKPDTEYEYYFKDNDSIGFFKTIPYSYNKDNVTFNLMSCFGYSFDNVTSYDPSLGIYPHSCVDFNMILGDIVYSDFYKLDSNSKIFKTTASILNSEYDEVYKKRLFNINKINKMFKSSLTIPIADDHEIFSDYSDFYRSFEYDTDPLTGGFTELQLAANIAYSLLSLNNPSSVPSNPSGVISQDDEYTLWSARTKNYSTAIQNGLTEYKNNITTNAGYYKFSYGSKIEFFVLNVQSDRGRNNDNKQVVTIIHNSQPDTNEKRISITSDAQPNNDEQVLLITFDNQMNINDNKQILSIISDGQMSWLLNSLSNSKAEIKFIVTSQAFSDIIIKPRYLSNVSTAQKLTFPQLYNAFVTDSTYYEPLVSVSGQYPDAIISYLTMTTNQKYRVFGNAMSQLNAGGWMFYDNSNNVTNIPQSNKQRNQIIDHIKNNNIKGVIFLTGDVHESYVGYVDSLSSPSVFPLIEIAASPSGSQPSTTISDYVQDNPSQQQYAYVRSIKNFAKIRTDIKNDFVTVEYIKKDYTTDFIKIDLRSYHKLQKGDTTQKPISVNCVPVL
jgi:phosphodiesterase/alkaline phosphatase D-like protein